MAASIPSLSVGNNIIDNENIKIIIISMINNNNILFNFLCFNKLTI